MELVQNVPFFCIMLSMFSGTVSSVLPGKWARRLNLGMLTAVITMSLWLLQYLVTSGTGSYTYMMGHTLHLGAMSSGSVCWKPLCPCSSA